MMRWITSVKCCVCGSDIDDGLVCSSCFGGIDFISNNYCCVCGKPMSICAADMVCGFCMNHGRDFSWARSIMSYNAESMNIVLRIKENADLRVTRILCAMIMAKYSDMFCCVDAVTCIPSHWFKILKRGFNGAQLIGIEIARMLGVPFVKMLRQNRLTNPQKTYSYSQRMSNVRDCFVLNRGVCDLSCHENILLVDDVMTTGATLESAARVLKSGGVSGVACVTIASTRAME